MNITSFSLNSRKVQHDLPLMVAPDTAIEVHSGRGYMAKMK